MPSVKSRTLHGLCILTPKNAYSVGFVSITTDIHAENEKNILAGVCQHRNPTRACLIQTRPPEPIYQLAVMREDISNLTE